MRSSIFLKLFMVLVVAGLAVNIAVYFAVRSVLRPSHHGRAFIDRNLTHYIENLTQELGVQPSRETIERVAKASSLAIRVESPNGEFISTEELPSWDEVTVANPPRPVSKSAKPGSTGKFFVYKDRPYLRMENAGGHYLFFARDEPPPEEYPRTLIVVLFSVTFVILLTYLVLRHSLSPLRSLHDGVVALGEGRLTHIVPVVGTNEFAILAKAFNEMTVKIHTMIKNREQLLIDVSHELRSPITRMKMAVALLGAEKNKERLDHNLVEMERMIAQLLESVRFGDSGFGLKTESLNIRELVDEVLVKHQNRKPGFSPTSWNRGRSPIEVIVDRARILTVLENLVDNALKYSEPNGQSIDVEVTESSDHIKVIVRDRGVGIPRDEITHVFEPFYRVDKSRSKETGGYGLGLNLCRRIILAHGGTIELESDIGEGTIVFFCLPKKETSAEG